MKYISDFKNAGFMNDFKVSGQ